MECCGITDPDDWKAVNNSIYLPPSCCGKESIDDTSTCIKLDAHEKGCKEATMDFLNKHILIFVGVGAGIAVLQVFKYWLEHFL